MNDELLILTPEKTIITLTPAGMGSRLFAFLLDVIVLLCGVGIISLLFTVGFMATWSVAMVGILQFVLVAMFFVYFFLSEILLKGRTLGKMAVGVRTVMADGSPLTSSAAVYRALLLIADLMPGLPLVGLTMMILTERSQRLGDLAAGTVVIRDQKTHFGFVASPHRAGLNRFEEYLPELKKMSMEEYHAIKRLTDRFPELPPSTQVRSIEEIWAPFAEKHGVQPLPNVHPIYLMEAVVVKYGRENKLI